MEPIKIFVGTDANGGCAENQMVFDYSLKKHCSVPYEIIWMKVSNDPSSFWYGWNTENWSTPFSGFRYGIAEYCNFKSRAIYCDDDQLWLDDPYKLWQIEIPKHKIMTGKQLPNGEIRHCVSVIDCDKWENFPKSSRIKHLPNFVDRMKAMTFPVTEVMSNSWNCFDGEDMPIDQIQLLHMTDMATNPGIKLAIKRLGDQASHWYDGPIREHGRKDIDLLFETYYNESLEAGYRVSDYISNEHVVIDKQSQKGYVANNGWDRSTQNSIS